MNTPAFLGSQRKEESHRFHPRHGGECIIEVGPFSLHENVCHQASLVLDDGTSLIPLQLEHLLKGGHAVTTREISKLPHAVLLNCVHLGLHHGTPCRVSLGLRERPRFAVVARKTQLRLQIMRVQSQHRLVTEKVHHLQYCNGSPSWYSSMHSSLWESGVANSTELCSTRAGVGVAIDAGVHGVIGCGGGAEDLVVAEVMAGEHCAEVSGGSGIEVDMLGGRGLPTPPAPLKWTYSTVMLSYVGVEPSSTALSHAHPRPSSNTTSRVVRTHCVRGSRMR
jgi:hypothetical protein